MTLSPVKQSWKGPVGELLGEDFSSVLRKVTVLGQMKALGSKGHGPPREAWLWSWMCEVYGDLPDRSRGDGGHINSHWERTLWFTKRSDGVITVMIMMMTTVTCCTPTM